LMKRSHLPTTLKVSAIEGDQMPILGERCGKRFSAASVPSVHQFLIKGADRSFVGDA